MKSKDIQSFGGRIIENVKIFNTTIGAVVDSGASATVMSKPLFDSLKENNPDWEKHVKRQGPVKGTSLIGITGHKLDILEQVDFEMEIRGKKRVVRTQIHNQPGHKMLLGTNTFNAYGMYIEFKATMLSRKEVGKSFGFVKEGISQHFAGSPAPSIRSEAEIPLYKLYTFGIMPHKSENLSPLSP